MSLLRNAIQSNISLRAIKPTHALPFLLRESTRRFSTETEQPPPQPPANDSSIDPFLRSTNEGLVYGKLFGSITKFSLKTDIVNLLEGCNLKPDDVKVNYTRNYMPIGIMVQFPSRHAFENAFKMLNRKGRLYRLEKGDRSDWDTLMPYNGRTILLQGIPLSALHDDVERFLAGCEFDASSIQFFPRPSMKIATVHFPSQTQAMHAFLTKNRSFCLNNQISVRVLQ